MAVTLYNTPVVINMTTQTHSSMQNFPLNRTDFQVARNVTTEVLVLVRDVDRKPAVPGSLTMTVVDPRERRIVMSLPVVLVDADQGLFKAVFRAADTVPLATGSLTYTVTVTRPDDTSVLLYTDRAYGTGGYLTVVEGPLPRPIEPSTITPDIMVADGPTHTSGAFPAAITGINTAALHLVGFTGTIRIEASLEDQPSQTTTDWFTMAERTFHAATGTHQLTAEGAFAWVRLCIIGNDGVCSKIVLRHT